MKVSGYEGKYIAKLYNQQQVRDNSDKAQQNVKKNKEESDSVKISSEARQMQKLVEKTMKISEVRTEKVNELKNKVEAGEFRVSAEHIADKLLEHMKDSSE